MKTSFPCWLPLFTALALGALACERKAPPAASQAPEERPLLVGVVGSLTGPEATFGQVVREGAQFAVDQVNASGGVKGRQVRLIVYDTQGKIEESVAAARRLLTQDRVSLIIGDTSSSGTLAFADAAQAAHVPVVAPAATHPDVTRKGDYIFRTCFIDSVQGGAMARFAREHLKLERVAVLSDNKNASSMALGEAFAQAFQKRGGTVVATETYAQGDTDFRASLLQVKKARPQALYLSGFYSEVGIIARQARELGLTLPLLGSDGWDSARLFELAGNTLEGSYFSTHFAADNPAPEFQRFMDGFRERYGRAPDASSSLGYDAAQVALAAMRRARSLSGPDLREALATTKDFPGATGSITFDAERNPIKPAVVLTVEQGQRRFVANVEP